MKIFYYNKAKNHTQSDTNRLIKESLGAYLGKAVSSEVKRTENGKPYIDEKGIYVGVSHTDSLVVIAIDSKDFGIDCEIFERTPLNSKRIANKYFSKNEFDYIYHNGDTSENSESISRRFLEIWVKKEAYVKYLGTGIKNMPDTDVFSLSGSFEQVENKDNLIYIYRP